MASFQPPPPYIAKPPLPTFRGVPGNYSVPRLVPQTLFQAPPAAAPGIPPSFSMGQELLPSRALVPYQGPAGLGSAGNFQTLGGTSTSLGPTASSMGPGTAVELYRPPTMPNGNLGAMGPTTTPYGPAVPRATGRFAGIRNALGAQSGGLPGELTIGGRAGLLGRGLGSAMLYQNLGQMASSALGGNDTNAGAMASAAGTTGALGSAAYGLGSAAGVVGGASAAAVGGAAAAGGAIAEGLARSGLLGEDMKDNSLTNVGGNITRKFSSGPGSLGNNMVALESVGIAPSAIAQALQSEQGEGEFAEMLLNGGVEGAKVDDDGQVNLSGTALAQMREFQALHGADDPFSKMMRDLINEGADPDTIDMAALSYNGLIQGDEATGQEALSPEQAVAGIRSDLETVATETTAAEEAERSYMANQLLLQQKAQEYMAPITGQMRQQADANYSMIEGMVGTMNLPPGMGEAMLMQAQGERTMQQATAAAYDNQMMVAAPVAAQQEYTQSMEGLAAQLMQQQQAQYIQSLTDPMAGMTTTQNPYATALQPTG